MSFPKKTRAAVFFGWCSPTKPALRFVESTKYIIYIFLEILNDFQDKVLVVMSSYGNICNSISMLILNLFSPKLSVSLPLFMEITIIIPCIAITSLK